MNNSFLGFTIKDGFIIIALIILLFLISRIKRLKRLLTEETLSRLMPEVGLIIDEEITKGFYLKNYSTSIARNIKIDNIELQIDDFGFKVPVKVVFEGVESLNPADKVRLNYTIFCRGDAAAEEAKDIYISHILFIDFDCQIHYENIQNIPFCSYVINRNGKFSIREVSRRK